MGEVFEVYCKGNIMSGYVTFWKTPKGRYMRQGIGNPRRCSKKLYEEAKAMYQEQQRELAEREAQTEDLISRSSLIEAIKKIKFQVNVSEQSGFNRPFIDFADVLSCINDQPTAYNVKKVLEQLKEAGYDEGLLQEHLVRDIVKKGGIYETNII